MKSRPLVFMVFLLLTALAVPTFAAGPYVGIEGGVVFLSDSTLSGPGGSLDLEYKTGFGAGLVGGFDFGTYRLEGEFAYRTNDHDQVSAFGLSAPADGDTSSIALMVNGYYDFRMVSPTIVPYVGVGIGGAQVSAKLGDPGFPSIIDDDDMVFAYQFMAGVGFAVNKQVTIDLGYKYFATADPSFEVIGTGGAKLDSEYKSHNVFAGLRYSF
jgi:opacity protein-like surface antigen